MVIMTLSTVTLGGREVFDNSCHWFSVRCLIPFHCGMDICRTDNQLAKEQKATGKQFKCYVKPGHITIIKLYKG